MEVGIHGWRDSISIWQVYMPADADRDKYVKNCLNTIQKATGLDPEKLDDVIIQDVFVLNLQRAIQASIDMANVVISDKGLKLPAAYKECFQILRKNQLIEQDIEKRVINMVGFRNIAVHDYQQIDVEILKSILRKNLKDFEEYYAVIYEMYRAV